MRWLVSASKAAGRIIAQRDGSRRLMKYSWNNGAHNRYLSSIVCTGALQGNKDMVANKHSNSLLGSTCIRSAVQRREFLGCGDGEEGNVLSKVYEERRILGYSPEQLFAVVAAVDLYQDFLPWCQRSDIIRRYPDGSFDAELEIGFRFLVESYVSHVEISKPKFIKELATFISRWISSSSHHSIDRWHPCFLRR